MICEALGSGKPVLASDVSDNKILIEHGSRGFLFQPELPISIAEKNKKIYEFKTRSNQFDVAKLQDFCRDPFIRREDGKFIRNFV